jgi:rhodanese-related sulfurtransferase
MQLFRGRSAGKSPYEDPARLLELIQSDEAHVLVDVRTEEEYLEGHNPTARLIPNYEILDRPPTPDKEHLIVLYCRSGARSGGAKQDLESLGYTNVVNFGGIHRWESALEYGPEREER